jgi:hypothetical protein
MGHSSEAAAQNSPAAAGRSPRNPEITGLALKARLNAVAVFGLEVVIGECGHDSFAPSALIAFFLIT